MKKISLGRQDQMDFDVLVFSLFPDETGKTPSAIRPRKTILTERQLKLFGTATDTCEASRTTNHQQTTRISVMRFISFKIITLCFLLPPVLYIASVAGIERYAERTYTRGIENVYLGDSQRLLEGRVRLLDVIGENIDRYLQSRMLTSFGLKAVVTVTTKEGTVLYPAEYSPAHDSLLAPDPMQIAAENFRLMQQGLAVKVAVDVPPTALLSVFLLAVCIVLGLFGLYAHYRSANHRVQEEDRQQHDEIQRLLQREAETTENLKNLMTDRENLTAELQQLKTTLDAERTKANRNEDEMIEEMVALEQKLEENLVRQQGQQEEIEALKEELKRFEKEKRKDEKQKVRAVEAAAKRFSGLYKNLTVNARALNGFVDLPEDLKIKAEEVIHQLNQTPELVTIKRKVFGKKNRRTVLEVVFGYKGRLYFMNTGSNIEVMAIGTKNTQRRELEFLDNL